MPCNNNPNKKRKKICIYNKNQREIKFDVPKCSFRTGIFSPLALGERGCAFDRIPNWATEWRVPWSF